MDRAQSLVRGLGPWQAASLVVALAVLLLANTFRTAPAISLFGAATTALGALVYLAVYARRRAA